MQDHYLKPCGGQTKLRKGIAKLALLVLQGECFLSFDCDDVLEELQFSLLCHRMEQCSCSALQGHGNASTSPLNFSLASWEILVACNSRGRAPVRFRETGLQES